MESGSGLRCTEKMGQHSKAPSFTWKNGKDLIQIAGITGSADVRLDKRALVAMCADNGVVEEGVTQTGQEVTAIVAENFLKGDTSACVMCRTVRDRCISC